MPVTESKEYMSVREQQIAELDVMKELHIFCEKHHLKYCLGEGTLLGAVRHKGFIPWDNDMDIYMPRSDMMKLMELADENHYITPNIRLFHHSYDPAYHYAIVRACNMKTTVQATYLREQVPGMGVWVDIFPLDGFSKGLYRIQWPLLRFFLRILTIDMYAGTGENETAMKRRIRRFFWRFFPDKNHRYERIIDRISSWKKYEKSDQVAVLCEEKIHPGREILKEELADAVLTEFEDTRLYIPLNPERKLKGQYGDYMKLPPEDKRIPHETLSRWIG